MAINISNRTRRSLEELSLQPNLVVKVDGYEHLFGALPIRELLTYGFDDTFFGDSGLFYGGLVDKKDQKPYIDSRNTTYSIQQQINYDDESTSGNSISSMTIGLVDKNGEVTRLITPGLDVEDVLGRKVEVFQVFGDTDFFEDSILVFKGFVTSIESGAGVIKMKINHPDNKKNVKLFQTTETQANGVINATQTTITVDDASTFKEPQGPLKTYIRIDEELIEYTGIAGNTFTGLIRGSLGTVGAAHDDNAQVRALFCLEDNPLDLALKLMISRPDNDPMHTGISALSFVKVGAGTTLVPNAIYFDQINIPQDYGLTVGDTIDITGATKAANNVTGRTVTAIERFESGYYIVVDGAALELEQDSSAVMATFSQYNVLPDGMRMKPEEVDIAEHVKLRNFFFSSTQFRLYLKDDDIEGKDFLDAQIYRPIACYSLPRKTRASVGYTVGPIPGEDIKTINSTVIKNPESVTITRTTRRSFFNEVVYKYDDDPKDSDERFLSGQINISQTSKNRIPGTTKTYVINAQGLRTDLNAQNIIASNALRILDRYKFGAEIISCRTLLRDTATLEIGDIVVAELADLQVSDISKGTRDFEPRLFEVQNKSINLKNGNVELTLIDTGLNINTRFGLQSPASRIAGVISQSQFVIGPDAFYSGPFGNDEFRKWQNVISVAQPVSIRVRNDDYSIDEDLVVTNINENTFTLRDPATIALTKNLFVEFTGYADADTSDKQKLIYAYMTDDANFADGGFQYSMI